MRNILFVMPIVAVLAGALPAAAEPDAAKVAESTRATNAFLALAAGSQTSGAIPRDSDPVVAELLSRILDETALGTGKPTLAEAAAASTLLENGTRVLTAYMLAGTGKTGLDALAGDGAALAAADANMRTFAPEVGRLYDFTARMQGVVADAVAEFRITASPEEVAAIEPGLADLRSGVLQTFGGILEDVGDGGFGLDWQKQRTAVLGDVGPKIAKVLEEGDVTTLRAQATAIAGEVSDPAMKSELQRFGLMLKAR